MIVLGLTGSVGMGKSTAAAAFARLRIPVFDSDKTAHGLLSPEGSGFGPVAERFPNCIEGGMINRQVLGREVFGNAAALNDLEAILHPMVRKSQASFLKHHARLRTQMVLFDIPLLYETGAEKRCDAVAVVTAPCFVQTQRVFRRPGMTKKKMEAILSRQMPDTEKRACADFIIQTGLGRAHALHQILGIVKQLSDKSPTIWPPGTRGSGRIPGRISGRMQ